MKEWVHAAIRVFYLFSWLKYARIRGRALTSKIALSFDDGPCLEHSLSLVKTLNSYGVQATFFWFVNRATSLSQTEPVYFQELIAALRVGGHEVGFHAMDDSWPTLRLRLLGGVSKNDMREGVYRLTQLLDIPVRLYRPHYLQLGPTVLHARDQGLTTVFGDPWYLIDPMAPPDLQVGCLGRASRGSILVLHESRTAIRESSHVLEVVPPLIRMIRSRGIEFEKVSVLLDSSS